MQTQPSGCLSLLQLRGPAGTQREEEEKPLGEECGEEGEGEREGRPSASLRAPPGPWDASTTPECKSTPRLQMIVSAWTHTHRHAVDTHVWACIHACTKLVYSTCMCLHTCTLPCTCTFMEQCVCTYTHMKTIFSLSYTHLWTLLV